MRPVVAFASAFLLALVLALALPAVAQASTPVLPESCGVAQRAPVLVGDDVQTDPADARVPIIMVHGWLGTATHDSTRTGAFSQLIDEPSGQSRSLIGMVQNLPGAAVYTFDYRSLAARWVTDPGIGDALASSIRCLTAASGTQAIVVAHSMGGLAAREALAETVDGVAIASLVSDVVTYGTPNTGSALAALLSQAVNTVDLFSPGRVFTGGRLGLTALLALCGAASTQDAVGAGCSGVPTLDAFASQAGIALRTGSLEIDELPPWPRSVRVVALVGDVRVPMIDAVAALTGIGRVVSDDEDTVSLGDIIVGTDSAESGVDERHVVTCAGSLAAGFGESLCQHANLMRNPVLAGWAVTSVATAVSRQLADADAVVPAKAAASSARQLATPRRRRVVHSR